MAFVAEHGQWSGPLGLLLELLDQNKLEIQDVGLAAIADKYLAYLDTNEVASEEMADFLVVASRLIYLKSRELMPFLRLPDEEDNVASLEEQLREYRRYVEAAEKIEALYAGANKMYVRAVGKIEQTAERSYVAPTNVSINLMREAMGWVLKRLEPFFALTETSMERVKSIETRIEEMSQAIQSRVSMKFREVVSGAKSKAEVVVSFLALLELVRRQVVKVSQGKDRDILIERMAV